MSLSALILAAGIAVAQPSAEVPRYADISGHEIAASIALSHDIERWLQALGASSPRVRYLHQGESWEGRPLMLAVITDPENHARMDEILDVARRMDDARLRAPTRDELARQPVIVWLAGSIHGFELSGTEGMLMAIEHLVLRDDEDTRELLRNAVVLVDPILNPDGRDAFAHHNHQRIGRFINPAREDWTNDFTFWEALSFRTSHWFFDINRDWFAHTHRETRFRAPTFQRWRPQVAVDAHEMGPDTEFYFDPPTEPSAPFFPEFARRGFEIFGAAHARAFEAAGIEYTKRQMFNYFYPGYTTSWSSYQGAVGMLYEQGSSRGLALERNDRTIRTLRDAGTQQYIATMAAVRASVANRERFLEGYTRAGREAVADGQRGIRRYLLPPTGDPKLHRELVELLVRNGIDVGMTREAVTLRGLRDARGGNAGTRTLPAGTVVIEAAQPRNRLIRTLMEPNLEVPAAFLRQARERIDRGENPRFYDITAYSLPLLFNAEAYSSSEARGPAVTDWSPAAPAGAGAGGYAWLVDGRQAVAAVAAVRLREQGVRVSVLPRPFRAGDRDYASGTLVVRVVDDGAAALAALEDLQREHGLAFHSVETGVAEGAVPALGAAESFAVRPVRVAMLGDHPVQAYSFGWAWFALEEQYRVPTTVLRTRSLGGTPLEQFDTLVIPALTMSGELTRMLGEPGQERLKRWVNDGGTLVAIASGADWVLNTLKLGSLLDWYEENKSTEPARIGVPGTFVRAVLDGEQWLASGYGADMPMLVNSDRLWLAPKGPANPRQRVVAQYAPQDTLRIAGHLWTENNARLPGTVAVYEERIGRGRVILFAEDPNFRGYWRGADRLFLNAVLLGPSAP